METMRSAATITVLDSRWAEITGTPEAIKLAEGVLWFWSPGYRYDPRYKRGLWNGKVTLLEEGYFLAGLAQRLVEELEALGVSVTWNRGATPRKSARYDYQWNDVTPGPLRVYQTDAFLTAASAGRGIVQMATGTGKTEVIAKLIHHYDTRTLVICNTKDLLHQTAARIQQRIPNAKVALVGDSYADFSEITVALFQALSQNIDAIADELSAFRMVIADEAHHVPADSFNAVMQRLEAPYRYGFTATPSTNEDGAHSRDLILEGHTGPQIFSYSAAQAIADGVLVAPHVFLAQYSTSLRLDPKRNDWAGLYREGIIEHAERNNAVAQMAATAAGEWGKTLVLVKEIDHMWDIETQIENLGVDAIPMHGKMTARQRKQQLSDFRDDPTVRCLISTGLFDEGVDVPGISAVVLATGGKADHKLMQRIGRGMRQGGADRLVVIDFLDTFHPILNYHSSKRRAVYAREAWETEVVSLD